MALKEDKHEHKEHPCCVKSRPAYDNHYDVQLLRNVDIKSKGNAQNRFSIRVIFLKMNHNSLGNVNLDNSKYMVPSQNPYQKVTVGQVVC